MPESPHPHPLPLVLRHVCRQRTLRRERGRSVNSHRIQAEITMLAVTDLTDLGGIHAGRKSLVVRQPRNSQPSFWCL